MNLALHNPGACGMVQMMYAGHVNFNTTGIATGVNLCKVPKGCLVTRAIAVVDTAFNAATTNVLTVGIKTNKNEILGADSITEGTTGTYSVATFYDMGANDEIWAKYTQSGTAATTGSADIWLEIVPKP